LIGSITLLMECTGMAVMKLLCIRIRNELKKIWLDCVF
jgi:hypothetical protein